jgi:hypothetical protein
MILRERQFPLPWAYSPCSPEQHQLPRQLLRVDALLQSPLDSFFNRLYGFLFFIFFLGHRQFWIPVLQCGIVPGPLLPVSNFST